jgi:hypothetical protein
MGIWGSGPNDVYAVGGGGVNAVIRHFDGRAWTTQTPDLGVMQPILLSIWGLSSVEMFAVGKHFESDVGVDQTLLVRGNGSAWTFMGLGYDIERIAHDVSGASAQDVYAVGNYFPAHGSFILHFDGTEWATESTSFGQEVLNGVWASSATDVFVVGGNADGGVILHFDGHHGWASMRAPAIRFNDIWGSSAADIYALGDGIAHYDGQTVPA